VLLHLIKHFNGIISELKNQLLINTMVLI